MNIHPLWAVCIFVRLLLIFIIRYNYKNNLIKNIFLFILLAIGLGFIYKFIFGSNNEIQLNKVFWHDSRLLHGVLYLTACYYLYANNINLNSIILLLDIIFSFLYRFLLNK
jgi:hypothetical protein